MPHFLYTFTVFVHTHVQNFGKKQRIPPLLYIKKETEKYTQKHTACIRFDTNRLALRLQPVMKNRIK